MVTFFVPTALTSCFYSCVSLNSLCSLVVIIKLLAYLSDFTVDFKLYYCSMCKPLLKLYYDFKNMKNFFGGRGRTYCLYES